MSDMELRIEDPVRRRERLYGMTECRTLFGETCLMIAWGVVGRSLRRRTELFADETELARRRKKLLARRKRAGYALLADYLEQSTRLEHARARLTSQRPYSATPEQLGWSL